MVGGGGMLYIAFAVITNCGINAYLSVTIFPKWLFFSVLGSFLVAQSPKGQNILR